jgi:hypothetical protein
VRYDVDVLDAIAAAVPAVVPGVSAFTGPARAVDDAAVKGCCVFVLATDGDDDEPIGAVALGSRTLAKPRVIVRVRSSRNDFLGGQELARACFDAVDRRPPAGYCDARARRSHPTYLGESSEGRHEWSFDLSLLVDRRLLLVYWGVGIAGLSTEADVLTLPASDPPRSGSARASNRYREFQADAGAGEKVYYWFPDDFAVPGTPSFLVGAMPGGFSSSAVVVDGVAGSLYESDGAALGPVTVEVS